MSVDAAWDEVSRYTDRLLESVSGLSDPALQAPSRCPGWTRGHVLAHLARNADALTRIVRATIAGETVTMYDSDTERDRAIEDGAERPLDVQAQDVRDTARELAVEAQGLGPQHHDAAVERTPGSAVVMPIRSLGLMRLNEVVLHHIDLDVGFGFDDLDDLTAGLLLRLAVDRAPAEPGLTIESDEGDHHVIGNGAGSVRGRRRAILAYLTRQQLDGVTVEERSL